MCGNMGGLISTWSFLPRYARHDSDSTDVLLTARSSDPAEMLLVTFQATRSIAQLER